MVPVELRVQSEQRIHWGQGNLSLVERLSSSQNFSFKVAGNPVFSRSTNLESKQIVSL